MKKITLFFALSLVSMIGIAQESNKTTKLSFESIERESEYIIVLDDVTVGDNIDKLLNNNVLPEDMQLNFNNHELVHDTPNTSDIESKFVEGAFTYNEYALNYSINGNKLIGLSS
jgi:hypothetical protein